MRQLRTGITIAAVASYSILDHFRPRTVTGRDQMPLSVHSITAQWLTEVLCNDHPAARVTDFRLDEESRGTNHRQRVFVEYNEAGNRLDLPKTIFTESTPRFGNRAAAAITNCMEEYFYSEMRGHLNIEAPAVYFSKSDYRRRALFLALEDLTNTKKVEFCTPATVIDRDKASQIVRTLATVHATFRGPRPPRVKTYVETWRDALSINNVERYHLRALEEGAEHFDPAIRNDPNRTWRAFLASLDQHESGKSGTILHNDVHIGNWYCTGQGRMGLGDWQALAYGNGARDLAYAVATALTPEDRRAWENDQIDEYIEEHARHTTPREELDRAELLRSYRAEMWGALVMWTITFSPPKMMPDMQPRETSSELLCRISTACADHNSFAAVKV